MTIFDSISTIFAPLYGMPCWRADQGFGSYLTLEFGPPILKVEEPTSESGYRSKRRARVVGTFTLFITNCHWILNRTAKPTIHSESSREEIFDALRDLMGEGLCKSMVFPETGTSSFDFDFGSTILCNPYSHTDADGVPYENWVLFQPNGNQLIYRADGKYSDQLDGKEFFEE